VQLAGRYLLVAVAADHAREAVADVVVGDLDDLEAIAPRKTRTIEK
jgi:hypothetical protein